MNNDLMKPRYKIIADYPGNKDFVGDVFEFTNPDGDCFITEGDFCEQFDSWPHLFKKLEWWEERKPEEMPEYVKHKNRNIICEVIGMPNWKFQFYLPATETEYNDYLKTKTP